MGIEWGGLNRLCILILYVVHNTMGSMTAGTKARRRTELKCGISRFNIFFLQYTAYPRLNRLPYSPKMAWQWSRMASTRLIKNHLWNLYLFHICHLPRIEAPVFDVVYHRYYGVSIWVRLGKHRISSTIGRHAYSAMSKVHLVYTSHDIVGSKTTSYANLP